MRKMTGASVGMNDESELGEWQGELPNLHSKNKTHDQRQHDAESEQQQSISRPNCRRS